MSRGRSRHQASRRRMYSARQRDLRERRLDAMRRTEQALPDEMPAMEIDDGADVEIAVPINLPLRRGATAA